MASHSLLRSRRLTPPRTDLPRLPGQPTRAPITILVATRDGEGSDHEGWMLTPLRCQSCSNFVLGGGLCKDCKSSSKGKCRGCSKLVEKRKNADGVAVRGKRRGRCYGVVYCSRECQRGDWGRHKEVCSGQDVRYLSAATRAEMATL